MDAMELLLNRMSIAPRLHEEPAPNEAELGQILAAACRAPDHGRLRPWRFIVIRGDARVRLGEVFAEALRARQPDTTAANLARPTSFDIAGAPGLRKPNSLGMLDDPVDHSATPWRSAATRLWSVGFSPVGGPAGSAMGRYTCFAAT